MKLYFEGLAEYLMKVLDAIGILRGVLSCPLAYKLLGVESGSYCSIIHTHVIVSAVLAPFGDDCFHDSTTTDLTVVSDSMSSSSSLSVTSASI